MDFLTLRQDLVHELDSLNRRSMAKSIVSAAVVLPLQFYARALASRHRSPMLFVLCTEKMREKGGVQQIIAPPKPLILNEH